MVIDDFDVEGIAVMPFEADSPLFVDTDCVLIIKSRLSPYLIQIDLFDQAFLLRNMYADGVNDASTGLQIEKFLNSLRVFNPCLKDKH